MLPTDETGLEMTMTLPEISLLFLKQTHQNIQPVMIAEKRIPRTMPATWALLGPELLVSTGGIGTPVLESILVVVCRGMRAVAEACAVN